MNVTFTIKGEDPDGDSLTWTLDADGDGAPEADGTDVPASFNHSYAEAGVYNATLTVSDGTAEDQVVVSINATAAGEGSGPVFEASGSFVAGTPYAACSTVVGGASLWGTPETEVSFDLPAETIGLPFSASFTATGEFVGVAATFWTDAGGFIDSASAQDSTVTGTVPAGPDYVSLSSCGPAVEVSVTFTVMSA